MQAIHIESYHPSGKQSPASCNRKRGFVSVSHALGGTHFCAHTCGVKPGKAVRLTCCLPGAHGRVLPPPVGEVSCRLAA